MGHGYGVIFKGAKQQSATASDRRTLMDMVPTTALHTFVQLEQAKRISFLPAGAAERARGHT